MMTHPENRTALFTRVLLGVILSAGNCALAADVSRVGPAKVELRTPVSAENKEIEVTPVTFALEVYETPLCFAEGKLVDEKLPESLPGWVPAYSTHRRLREVEYEQFVGWFTPAYIAARGITKESFQANKSRPPSSKWPPNMGTALYALYISSDEREFCFVVFDDFHHLSKIPDDINAVTPAIRLYEKLDGVWKNQLVEEAGVLRYLSFTSLDMMKALLKEKTIELNQFNVIQPSQ